MFMRIVIQQNLICQKHSQMYKNLGNHVPVNDLPLLITRNSVNHFFNF